MQKRRKDVWDGRKGERLRKRLRVKEKLKEGGKEGTDEKEFLDEFRERWCICKSEERNLIGENRLREMKERKI